MHQIVKIQQSSNISLLVFNVTGMCVYVSPKYGILCRDFLVVLSHEALGLLYIAGGAAGVILVWLGGVVHLPNDLSEQFVHHGFALSGCLHEGAAPLFSQGLALTGRHLPLTLQVHLVPNQDHRHLLVSFHSDDLISHRFYVLEALLVDKAVDQYESLSIFDVKVPHGCELLCASSVKNLQNRG